MKDPPHLAHHVTDIGCGSGASILAFLAFLEDSLTETSWRIDVTLIDRSEEQLNLLNDFFKWLNGEFQYLKIYPHFYSLDLKEWQPRADSSEVILLSHILSENKKDVKKFLEKASLAISGNGQVYIIERENDIIWDTIDKNRDQFVPFIKDFVNLYNKSNQFINPLNKNQIKTNFMMMSYPKHKKLMRLLELYFQAWENQSPEILEEIFVPEAVYNEKPFQKPLQGLEEIKSYWRNNVLKQKYIKIEITRVAYTEETAFAEWEAEFIQSKKKVQLKGVLILKVCLWRSRIIALDEYYRSRKFKKREVNDD